MIFSSSYLCAPHYPTAIGMDLRRNCAIQYIHEYYIGYYITREYYIGYYITRDLTTFHNISQE